MLVFIDESGCSSFKLNRGSSSCFVIAMVLFSDNKEAEKVSRRIAELRRQLRVKPEFKFSKVHNSVKDAFFQGIKDFKFQVRGLVVLKTNIYNEQLRTSTESFYNFFFAQLMKYDKGMLKDAAIKLDGRGERRFTKELTNYLRKQLPKGKLKKLKLVDSNRDNLIQLADMVAGAIARSFHEKRANSKWLDMLKQNGQISGIWEFK